MRRPTPPCHCLKSLEEGNEAPPESLRAFPLSRLPPRSRGGGEPPPESPRPSPLSRSAAGGGRGTPPARRGGPCAGALASTAPSRKSRGDKLQNGKLVWISNRSSPCSPS